MTTKSEQIGNTTVFTLAADDPLLHQYKDFPWEMRVVLLGMPVETDADLIEFLVEGPRVFKRVISVTFEQAYDIDYLNSILRPTLSEILEVMNATGYMTSGDHTVEVDQGKIKVMGKCPDCDDIHELAVGGWTVVCDMGEIAPPNGAKPS